MAHKIVLFSRTSTVQQDVEQQTKALIKEGERLGYSKENQIIVEYQESAISLNASERAGIKKLKKVIEEDNSIDTMLCWELTRIARRADVIYNIRDFLIEHKIRWIVMKPSTMELIDSSGKLSQMSSLLLGIFTSFAESEMQIKKERFARARAELKAQGLKSCGATRFGYLKTKEKKCILHPLHSKIIIDAFTYYSENETSLYGTYLYLSGKYPEIFPVKEYKKAQRAIAHMFDKEVYAKGDWCYPPIISEELYNKVHEKLSKGKCNARYNSKLELLCRGHIYCGKCGRKLVGCGGNVQGYVCATDKLHSCQINIKAADWIMWEHCRTIVNINGMFEDNERKLELNQDITAKKNLLEGYKTSLEDIQNKKNKLLDLYINNKIDKILFDNKLNEIEETENELNKDMNKIIGQINSLQGLIDEISNNIGPKNIVVDNVTDFNTKLEYIKKYIDKMIVTNVENGVKTIRFEYTRPLIDIRCTYRYEAKNQYKFVWRINEDGTEDLILKEGKLSKRNELGIFYK